MYLLLTSKLRHHNFYAGNQTKPNKTNKRARKDTQLELQNKKKKFAVCSDQ